MPCRRAGLFRPWAIAAGGWSSRRRLRWRGGRQGQARAGGALLGSRSGTCTSTSSGSSAALSPAAPAYPPCSRVPCAHRNPVWDSYLNCPATSLRLCSIMSLFVMKTVACTGPSLNDIMCTHVRHLGQRLRAIDLG